MNFSQRDLLLVSMTYMHFSQWVCCFLCYMRILSNVPLFVTRNAHIAVKKQQKISLKGDF